MKTKIFLAFIIVILAALLSNFIFEWLIIKDFDNYVSGVKEDQLYWILASVEGSYSNGRWDKKALSESIHWAIMLGINASVLDEKGREVITSKEVLNSLSGPMKHRMEDMLHIHETGNTYYDEYPLFIKGKRIGTLLSHPFQKKQIMEKEAIFKKRIKKFFIVSFLIAGAGSIIIALLFSQFLSKPIITMRKAAKKIAEGDFSIRIPVKSHDEVGRLSESFNMMADALHKEEKLREHLMSNIAHELRTPLTIMKAHAEAVEDGVIEDKTKGIETIKNEIDAMIKLVKGIEDITMAEASFLTKGEMTEINLREFILGLVNEIKPAFIEKGLDIKINAGNDIFVTTDIEKLERIIKNTISNSLKFTEKGGVHIDYGLHGKEYFIEIKDTGKGITENEISNIFNRFYRLDKSKEGGLGIGLSIVKELVNVMGGKIEVKSKPGTGTSFRIYFPVS
ncbi:MAG: HAMP domain-containing sensor histidine kinase [Thermodesulfovibrionales bacterium]|nr:HAMP domain-containing sensor histidine kinase [Thermodesulfovibrionales bacterium]